MKSRLLLALVAGSCAACVTTSPMRLTASELERKGSVEYDAQFQDVFDAAYLALQQQGYVIAEASRLEGHLQTDRIPFTPPAGWPGEPTRSYRVEVFQRGAQVAVVAVPQVFADATDQSDGEVWVLGSRDGEEERWHALHERIGELLEAWRSGAPELNYDGARFEARVLGYRVVLPHEWQGIELSVDRRAVVAQVYQRGLGGCPDCPGGLNPTIVLQVERRAPPDVAPRVVREALERALGPRVAEPEAWQVERTTYGERGLGVVLAGEGTTTRTVLWMEHDLGNTAWMIRVAAACAAEGPAACEPVYAQVVDGIIRFE